MLDATEKAAMEKSRPGLCLTGWDDSVQEEETRPPVGWGARIRREVHGWSTGYRQETDTPNIQFCAMD